ncbi:hypothetical protein [Roseibium sp. Sym1]|uniref:hypothetical protein n=1 Tax=Roseibium sp. Sym1 TaxID=3016006 RepID=UPI0022B58F9D|nr:hypothetical protein [Roseibium sp. Sym1]
MFLGFATVVVGGGESLSVAHCRMIGMARATDKIRVVAINDAIYPCWFADLIYACDRQWWNTHGDLSRFPGNKLRLATPSANGIDTNAPNIEISSITKSGTTGFDDRPGYVRTGGNGCYQVMNHLVHCGVRRIILVGIDMKGQHWFGDHPTGCFKTAPKYERRISEFSELADELRKRDVDVVNCSPGTSLKCFRLGDLASELQTECEVDF